MDIVKENMLDVLIYLFEHYLDDEAVLGDNRESVKSHLVVEGFQETTIENAFIWLEGLALSAENANLPDGEIGYSFRIYTPIEQNYFSTACQGFLHNLEGAGVLDGISREMVIEQAMALDADDLDLEQLKWVVQLVLSNLPVDTQDPQLEGKVVLEPVSELLH